MAINRIFQRFDLDLESMARSLGLESMFNLDRLGEKSRGKLTELNFPKATETLRQKLLEKGYEVLESNDVYCGLHGSIILGGELGKMNHKEDFYELAAEFNLPYRSGHSYFPQEAKNEQEQLAQSQADKFSDHGLGPSKVIDPKIV